MCNDEITAYQALNELAAQKGIVIFGGSADREIPLCELKQAFSLDADLYNRSFTGLSVDNASVLYDACVADLQPETILLHLGEADLHTFRENSAVFDQKYRALIAHIRTNRPQCNVTIISLSNPENAADIAEMNRHLQVIAETEQCAYGDIASKRVWNPKETKNVISFMYSLGFVHPLMNRRPVYDLIKILFCCTPSCAR